MLGGLPGAGRASLAATGPVLVLADAVPMRRDGVDLKRHVLELLAPLDARLVTIGDADHEVHADMETVDAARPRSRAPAAWSRSARAPSATSARRRPRARRADALHRGPDRLLRERLLGRHGGAAAPRRQADLPSRWPDALVIDLGVIAEAPAALNQAGVGELSSMFTAPADWRLADLLGLDARL